MQIFWKVLRFKDVSIEVWLKKSSAHPSSARPPCPHYPLLHPLCPSPLYPMPPLLSPLPTSLFSLSPFSPSSLTLPLCPCLLLFTLSLPLAISALTVSALALLLWLFSLHTVILCLLTFSALAFSPALMAFPPYALLSLLSPSLYSA